MLTDGPLAGGSWNAKQLSFLLIYNAELPFLYSLRIRSPKKTAKCKENASATGEEAGPSTVRYRGSWELDGARGLEDSYHGTLKLELEWQGDIPPPAVPPSDTAATGGGAVAAPLAALPLPGHDGNRACEVRPVTALSVPCSMCSEEQGDLSFFDMVVPHFGTAELVSFSCAACGYKYNKVGTAVGQRPGPCGKTIRLEVCSEADLKREVVISDVATVTLAAAELEVQAVGRYTTVEGLITGLAGGLARAALVRGVSGSGTSSTDGPSEAGGNVTNDSGLRGVVNSVEARIKDLIEGCVASPFTVQISDPLALSFIAEISPDHSYGDTNAGGSNSAPASDRLEVEEWPRSPEDDLELGLVDATEAGQRWCAADGEAVASAASGQGNVKIGEESLTSAVDTYGIVQSVLHSCP
jgi:C4-type Zn-finger protein